MLSVIEDNLPYYNIVFSKDDIEELMKNLPTQDKKVVQTKHARIAQLLASLKNNDMAIFNNVFSGRKVLPIANDGDAGVADFRQNYTDMVKSFAENQRSSGAFYESENWKKFKEVYYQVPRSIRYRCEMILFTRDEIKQFADWCNSRQYVWRARAEATYLRKPSS